MSAQGDLRDITDFLKNQRTARDSKALIQRPDDIDDDSNPRLQERASRWYAEQILKKSQWTPEETAFIGAELGKYARELKP